MAFPPDVPVRSCSFGGAMVLESSDLLKVRVTVTASKSLVRDDTGYRFEKLKVTSTSELGSEVIIPHVRTDVPGWRDPSLNAIIDVSEPGSYTHRYTALVEFLGADDRAIGVRPIQLGPYTVPDGEGVIDLDKIVPASTTAGDVVSIPDLWGQLVAQAEAAASEAQAAIIDSDAFMAEQIATPGTETNTQLSLTIGDVVEAESDQPASTGFLRLAGTEPGSVPVVKPQGDGRAAVWEMVHNDTTGYLFHLLTGANMGHSQALIGLGVDNDGIGLLIPNKLKGRAIVGDQRATVTAEDAYWLHATQRSTAASLVRLEQQASGAAPLIQLLAFSSTSGKLLHIVNADGEAASWDGPSGVLSLYRTLRLRNQANGEVPSYLELGSSASATASTMRKAFFGADGDVFFGNAGAAGGTYYPYKVTRSSSSLAFQTAPNVTGKGTEPAPEDVAAWTTQLGISQTGGVVAATQFRTGGSSIVGFFGATPVAKPAGVAVTPEGIHAALVSLGLIGA